MAVISIILDTSIFQNKGRAHISNLMDNRSMNGTYDTNAMRKRLLLLLEQSGLSMREASKRGDTTPGYLHSVLKDGAEPTVQKLAKICEANGFSLAFVLFGFEISPETERLMTLMEQDTRARDGILALLEKD